LSFIFILAGIVSVLLIGAVIIKYKKRGAPVALFLLLLFCGLFFAGPDRVWAATRCQTVTSGGGGGNDAWQTFQVCFTSSMDKGEYCPGENMLATMRYDFNCLDYDYPMFGCTDGSLVRSGVSMLGIARNLFPATNTAIFTAPAIPESYVASFWGSASYTSVIEQTTWWTVNAEDSVISSVVDCSVTPPSPPPPVGSNPLPEGFYNGSDNTECSVSGWARDASAPNQSVGVRIFRGGKAPFDGGNGVPLASGRADVPMGGAVGNHGFRFSFRGVPGIDDGNSRITYAYADDIPGGERKGLPLAIGGSRFLQCLPPAPFCGDGTCNNSETCSSCPGDCGACACVPGANTYFCNRGVPICDQSNCNGQAVGSVACAYSNNCGTFSGTIIDGRCGNVSCVPSTIDCDCEKWREVAP
jgi:hypothetical protein